MAMLSKMMQYCKLTFSFKRKKADAIHGLEAGAKLDEAAGKMQVDPVVAIDVTQIGRVDDEMHTSIPSTLLANGLSKVEVLIFAHMHGAPPAAEDQHLDQISLGAAGTKEIDPVLDGEEHPSTLCANGVPNVEVLVIGDMQKVPPAAAAVHHCDQVGGQLSATARGSLTREKIFGVLKRISSFAASTVIATVVVAHSDAVAFAPSTTVTGLLIIMFADGLLLHMVHIFREDIFPEQARPWQYKLIKFSIVLLFTSTTTCFILVVAKSNNNNNSDSN